MLEEFFGNSKVLCVHGRLSGCRECNYSPEFNRLINNAENDLSYDQKMNILFNLDLKFKRSI